MLALHKADVKTYLEDYNETSEVVVNRTYAFAQVTLSPKGPCSLCKYYYKKLANKLSNFRERALSAILIT